MFRPQVKLELLFGIERGAAVARLAALRFTGKAFYYGELLMNSLKTAFVWGQRRHSSAGRAADL
jgi:hypothetical protein